jgi:hypothetical protein
MARVINGSLTGTQNVLTETDRRRAKARLARRVERNPLRRVQLACEVKAQRDPLAVVGDLVWCDPHEDFARVVAVTE